MAQLEFHTGIADVMDYCCRLLRKAYRRDSRVIVFGAPEQLARLDVQLWTFEQLEFIPHLRLRMGERPSAATQRTPIWLVDRGAAPPPADVAINLGDEPIDEPQACARVIELVGDSPQQRQAGRARWRHYMGLGLRPVVANAPPSDVSTEGSASA
jgi:DNA polymerase-3 subunit chi